MKCPNCQTELPKEAKFCMTCGQTLQNELVCPQCQHPNPSIAKFCLQCGQPLKSPCSPSPVVPDTETSPPPSPLSPSSFSNGRYQVKKFLGEGGKKKVYLAHDT
ncbi:MAG: zinc-ribbon domain-containing protein, partial [Thermodesulfobacteriota bacterium]